MSSVVGGGGGVPVKLTSQDSDPVLTGQGHRQLMREIP